MNILIIGGSSFVAKSFILYHQLDCKIKTVSRTNTGYENEFITTDFLKIPDELFQGVDVVLNCAGIVHQRKKVPEPLYHKINFELAVELAEQSKKNGVKIFIQLSTIAVYGNAERINSETPENPVNPYGKSKLSADKKILSMADDFFQVIIFRPPMIYGGGNAPGNMMRLINLVNKGFPLPFKNANQKRDFINIRNFVDYLEASIQTNKTNIYLVSDDFSVSTYQLINIISKHMNKKAIQFSIPIILLNILRKIKPEVFDKLYGKLNVDSGKSKEILRYSPRYSVEQGMEEMINWYKSK